MLVATLSPLARAALARRRHAAAARLAAAVALPPLASPPLSIYLSSQRLCGTRLNKNPSN